MVNSLAKDDSDEEIFMDYDSCDENILDDEINPMDQDNENNPMEPGRRMP